MRTEEVYRKTKETEVKVKVNLDGEGKTNINTSVPFLDHMLTSLATHSLIDIDASVKGDLVHHMVEDLALGLGEALNKALGHTRRHHTLRQRSRPHGLLTRIRRRRPRQTSLLQNRPQTQRQKSRRNANRRHSALLRIPTQPPCKLTYTSLSSTAATTTTKQKPPPKPSHSHSDKQSPWTPDAKAYPAAKASSNGKRSHLRLRRRKPA